MVFLFSFVFSCMPLVYLLFQEFFSFFTLFLSYLFLPFTFQFSFSLICHLTDILQVNVIFHLPLILGCLSVPLSFSLFAFFKQKTPNDFIPWLIQVSVFSFPDASYSVEEGRVPIIVASRYLFEMEKSWLVLYFLPSQIKLSSAACNWFLGFTAITLLLIENVTACASASSSQLYPKWSALAWTGLAECILLWWDENLLQ